jgi:DNA-binding transcriptional regulator YiaG
MQVSLTDHAFDRKPSKSQMRKSELNPTCAPTQTALQMNADEAALPPPIPVPCNFSLRHLADSIPGGLETIIVLAWLSDDDRARAVRDCWNSLSRRVKHNVEVEDLCRAVGIDAGHFFGIVAATAFRLGMDISVFIGGVLRMTTQVVESVNRVITGKGTGRSKQFWKSATVSADTAAEPNKGVVGRRTQVQREERCCDGMAAFREKWGLSQRQFAALFATDIRSVRRWEHGQLSPSPRQRWCLWLLVQYVNRNGLRAFQRRLVRQSPRYRKPGRPVSA